jgi:nucleoside-diphosphate-sugar epimerase
MTRVLVTGADGMIGRKLVARLAADGMVAGRAIEHLVLADMVAPEAPAEATMQVTAEPADLSDSGVAERLVAERPDFIFHLAAIVSGEAESDFDKGYRVNFDGTRQLLEAIRLAGDGYRPRFVFASSIAVFGAPYPAAIGDEFLSAPLTSYGTQKAMVELLLMDYTRRGFFDGIGIRLPTICVRPGKPNKAASGFFSNIIREPLAGQEAVLPVPDTVRHWHASPRAAVAFLIHAAMLDGSAVGPRRPPCRGLGHGRRQIASLRRVAGEGAGAHRREPDATITRIVGGWRSGSIRSARWRSARAENHSTTSSSTSTTSRWGWVR